MKSLLLAGLTLIAADVGPSIPVADRAQGARADVRLRRASGGRYDCAQSAYVREVGRSVAARSGLSSAETEFTITLLDSPVENAFALPGGYVYVTRQLLALMNSEAQLASVLGHEVGHVAARHSAGQRRTERIGHVLARVVDAMAGDDALGTLIGRSGHVASALYALKYSRDQEYAADRLGLGYATAAGYSPYAAAAMLAQLDAGATLRARMQGRDGVPTWVSTHPNGAERVRRAVRLAAATGQTDAPAVQDTAFLRRLDGMRYDDDPGDGVVRGQIFEQPRLRFRLTAPPGYALKRVGRVVHIAGSEGQALAGADDPRSRPRHCGRSPLPQPGPAHGGRRAERRRRGRPLGIGHRPDPCGGARGGRHRGRLSFGDLHRPPRSVDTTRHRNGRTRATGPQRRPG